jgi:tetratricopeptide (TPR) repeat protein
LGVDARGAALLFSGQNGGEVEGATLWSAVEVDAENVRATIVVMAEVDGRELLAGSRYLPVPIEIYGYLIDDAGTVVGHLSEGLLIDDCDLVRAIRETGLKFVGELDAPAGLFSLRIIVRNRETRRFFLARRDLDIGDDLSSRPFLLPPLAAEPEGRWVVAGQYGIDPEALLEKMPGFGSWPAALPAWRSNEALKLVIGVAGQDARPRVSAHLFDPSGLPMPDPELTIGEEVATAGAVVFRRATVAGTDVPPGPYRLQLVLGDADSGETISQSLPVVIYEGAERLTWTDPAAPRGSRPEPLPSRVETDVIADAPEETARAAYTDALRLWSRGEVIDARRRLAGLEQPLAGADLSDPWRRIFTTERSTILALAEDLPASLVGVAMLHRDMYGWYLARRDTDLAEHSWQMAAMIAREARSIEGWQPPPGFSECLLLDLATKLAATGNLRSTKLALEAAAEIAPGSAAPQLGLGALHERTGNPAGAVDALQKLVRDHPENLEGRLRLSVNRRRLGAEKAAEKLLRGLLESSAPRWIRTLAYQELGGLLVSEGRIGEAVELLREGVRRIPDNQRLQILELRALDLAGRSQEADSVVKALGARISQQSTSPRYRYSRWPDLDGDRVRSTLDAAEAEGVAALKEALP